MKELSIEEKASRYDAVINRMKHYVIDEYGCSRIKVDDVFPELAELKNEKMIQYFKDLAPFDKADELYEKYGFSHKDALAWLEKQGEHANFLSKIQIGDKLTRNQDGVLVNLSQLKRVAKKDENQGEHKPADKVEPKFHKGDWVVYCNDDVDLITGIEEDGYCINNGGYIPFVCENEMRLWDITDAKVGDVLVSEPACGLGTWYCIFKSLDGYERMTVHCYLSRDGRFETKKELCFNKDPYSTKPATKEQRDLLFQKMKEAGYEWDAEKKELKKIENEIEIPFGAKDSELQEATYFIPQGYYAKIESDKVVIKKGEQKSWSEEDRIHLGNCIAIIQRLSEDEANWLKSLKERYAWKPSDEQMNALNYVVNLMASSERPTENDLYYNILKSLRQQLKKHYL